MSLFLSMLRHDVEDRPQALSLVEEMSRCMANLNGVVSNILHFAKERSITKIPVNVHSIVQDVGSHLRSQMPKGSVLIEVHGSPFINGDEHALRQVFYNLLTNAAQAVDYLGNIKVCVKELLDGEGIVIRIEDDGNGIEECVLDKLFQPFVSARTGGTGLGLSIVQQIVELHSGSIRAWNEGGAVFELKLPKV